MQSKYQTNVRQKSLSLVLSLGLLLNILALMSSILASHISLSTTIVYADQQTPTAYNITYVLDGGTNNASNPTTYVSGTGIPMNSLQPATKYFYLFLGWYDSETGGNKVDSIEDNDSGNKVLYARWTPELINISYFVNGGIGESGGANDFGNPSYFAYGTGIASFNSATKIGYQFLGWFDAPTGGKEITGVSPTATVGPELYAHWRAEDYSITYELDGGKNNVSNPPNYTYGIGVASFEPATKEGSTFLGWFDAATGGNEITEISDSTLGNQTLYAHFAMKQVTTVQSDEPTQPSQPTQLTQSSQPSQPVNETLPYAGEKQKMMSLLIGIVLVALFSLLSWVEIGKCYARNSE